MKNTNKMFQIIFATLLVLLLTTKSQSILDVYEFKTILDFAKKTVSTEKNFLNTLGDDERTGEEISNTLDRMRVTEDELKAFIQTLAPLEYFYPLLNSIRPAMSISDPLVLFLHDFDDYLHEINKLYKTYVSILNNQGMLNHTVVEQWVNVSTSSEDHGLLKLFHEFYSGIIEPQSKETKSIFHIIAPKLPFIGPKYDCGFHLSIQQRLHYFYQVFMIYQLRGFVMNVYANTLKSIIYKTTDKSAYEKAEAQVVLSIAEYILAVKSAMTDAPRYVETCDAKVKTPETYTALFGLLQSIIVNEYDTASGKKCEANCKFIDGSRSQKCHQPNNYCAKKPCHGRLDGCSMIEQATVCELPVGSTRRYEWYQDADRQYFGTPTSCAAGSGGTRVHPTGYAGNTGHFCDTCLCMCIEQNADSPAIRAVSFRPQIAAIEDNMVVAGIRIIQADKIIQLQIKQGKLIANGRIDPSTSVWLKTEKMYYNTTDNDSDLEKARKHRDNVASGAFEVYNEESKTWKEMKSPDDYAFLRRANRAMHLDEINIDNGYVMTGARWSAVPNRAEMIIQIEVHATKYDPKTGQLDPKDSKWVTPKNMPYRPKEYRQERKRYHTQNLRNPLKSPNSPRNSHPNQWLHFHATSFSDDAGQETIPFFDTQPVETYPSIASVGLEQIYRARPGYAGFVAFRLIAVDLSEVWTVDANSDNVSGYRSSFSDKLPFAI